MEALDSRQAMIAHREWKNRPADQRFSSLEALREAVNKRRMLSTAVSIKTGAIKLEANAGDGITVSGADARFTHWSFGQVAALADFSAKELRKLPAQMSADILNHQLQKSPRDSLQVYVGAYEHGDPHVRAFNSDRYSRVHDADRLDEIIEITRDSDFAPPMGYAGGVWGAPMVPSGLYASDRDMFVMLTDEKNIIETKGEVLKRGFIVANSEVGAGTYDILAFLYRAVCGNNIIHGGQLLADVKIRHVGSAEERARMITGPVLRHYVNQDTSNERRIIEGAMATNVGANDAETTAYLVNAGFPKSTAVKAVAAAVQEEGGAGTLWQAVQGLTALARTIQHADARVDAERAAGKLLQRVA